MDPPQCIQNAMMTKDKKPFTYTPGGIDLSEIKSPRLGRRIERNANFEGVPDVPRQPQVIPQNLNNLPPSTLMAMQPQMHVQVLPPGQVPTLPGKQHAAPPPPPPPPSNKNMPPPPPLPTQKVMTTENQVVERPDMTKIIPENPMALLRKTSGPKPRKGVIEQMYGQPDSPVAQPQYQQQPLYQQQQRTPPVQPTPQYQQPQYQQQREPQYQQQREQQYQKQRSPPAQQAIPEPTRYQQPATVQRNDSVRETEEPPRSKNFSPPIKVIERQPAQEATTPPMKTSTAHLGTLYIPPISGGQQQQNTTGVFQQQQKGRSPPTPPERQPQSPESASPGTPTLNKAPKPWQKQQPQQEVPPWARKDTPQSQPQAVPQQQPSQIPAQPQPGVRWSQGAPKSPSVQTTQNSGPGANDRVLRVNIITHDEHNRPCSPKAVIFDPITGTEKICPVSLDMIQDLEEQNSNPGAVYVTQPLVFQHPGGAVGPQQQYARNGNQGASRVIPLQPNGATRTTIQSPNTPNTPGNDRSLNRQQSWSNKPTQSKCFKVIQKITQTEDDDDDNLPITEHSPRFNQEFRKMKMNDDDRNLMNKFKQGIDEDRSLHNEVDPRYRGGEIPSKAFRLLQSMTGGPNHSASVSSNPAPGKTPQVRTIPIQIEGEPERKYIPPSEQTVPEPKKYTGSSIPSRSFKILQAMTAPDTCAYANEVNENLVDPSFYNYPYYYDPNYPPVPPPYWYDYNYPYYYHPHNRSELSRHGSPQTDRESSKTPTNESEEQKSEVRKTGRQTPVPFMGYHHNYNSYYYPNNNKQLFQDESNQNGRETPRNRNERCKSETRSIPSQTPVSFSESNENRKDSRTGDKSPVRNRNERCKSEVRSIPRQTPVPFLNYCPSPYPFIPRPLMTPTSDIESDTESIRKTPLPFWGYNPYYSPYGPPFQGQESTQTNDDIAYSYNENYDENYYPPAYPPYWDPYYYPPYYGYPPVYPPYGYYGMGEEEAAGYSSTDEMALYANRFNQEDHEHKARNEIYEKVKTPVAESSLHDDHKEANEDKAYVSNEYRHTEAVKENHIIDTTFKETELTQVDNYFEVKQENELSLSDDIETEIDKFSSDSDSSDSDTEKDLRCKSRNQSFNQLHSFKSVNDISVYVEVAEADSSDSDSSECSEDGEQEEYVYVAEDETMPHQLSVILEESERTDTSRLSKPRRESVCSDASTIADRTEDIEDEICTAVNVSLPVRRKNKIEGIEEHGEIEVCATVTLKSPSLTPKHNRSPCRLEEDIIEDIREEIEASCDILANEEDLSGNCITKEDDDYSKHIYVYEYNKEDDQLPQGVEENEDETKFEEKDEEPEIDFWSTIIQNDTDSLRRNVKYKIEAFESIARDTKESEAKSKVKNKEICEDKEIDLKISSEIKTEEQCNSDDASINKDNAKLVDDENKIKNNNIKMEEIKPEKKEEDNLDFWSIIKKDDDENFAPRSKRNSWYNRYNDVEYEDLSDTTNQTYINHNDSNIYNDNNESGDNNETKEDYDPAKSTTENIEKEKFTPNIDYFNALNDLCAKITENKEPRETNLNISIISEDICQIGNVLDTSNNTPVQQYIEDKEPRETNLIISKNGEDNCQIGNASGTSNNTEVQGYIEHKEPRETNLNISINSEDICQIGNVLDTLNTTPVQQYIEDKEPRETNLIISKNSEDNCQIENSYGTSNNTEVQGYMENKEPKETNLNISINSEDICQIENVFDTSNNTEVQEYMEAQETQLFGKYTAEDSAGSIEGSSYSKSQMCSDNEEKKEASENCDKNENENKPSQLDDKKAINEDKNIVISSQNIVVETTKDISNDLNNYDSSISDSSSSESEDEEIEDNSNQGEEAIDEIPQPLSIKERIKALQESVRQKQMLFKRTDEAKAQVAKEKEKQEKMFTLEVVVENQTLSKTTTSTKSSLRSFEELSEEDDFDSGVTDMSRHISDNEEFSELGKMSKYQRAATHSRLFKLLQEEGDDEDDDILSKPEEIVKPVDKFSKLSIRKRQEQAKQEEEKKEMAKRKDKLSLPLQNVLSQPDSASSSNLASPVNEKLVNELIQSMLKQKKGKIFRSMSMNKLRAAAVKILQEENDTDTAEDVSSFMSPRRSSTDNSTAAQTPQEFYNNNNGNNEYKDYYDSWQEFEDYDILPSKAFKLIQEHAESNKTGAVAGLLAKCPRILSSRNVNKDLIELLESSEDNPTPTPEQSLERNEVTSAS